MLSPSSPATDENSEAAARRCLAAIGAAGGEGARTFTQVYERAALEEARAADARRLEGARRSPIDGCIVAIKDLFDVRGQVTWAGSRTLQTAPPAAADAAAVARLRSGGAVIIGKTNMTEFAYSGVGLNPHFGTPANPYGRSVAPRIPGGSSSGAAVAVADGMADIGLGTDTGGSVRIPAALCGLVGWKPTARRISLEGVWPLAHTFDSVGVITRTAETCIAADEVLAAERVAAEAVSLNELRLGRLRGYVESELEAPVARAYERALERLGEAGAQIVDFEVPELERVVREQPGVTMTTYEAFHAHAGLLDKSGDLYDPRVRTRLELGRPITAEQYAAAAAVRRELQAAAARAFRAVDACLYPTVRITAPPFPAFEADVDYLTLNRALLRNTSLINLLDGCALSLPCHDAGQAPVGLSIAGPALADGRVLSMARLLEPIVAAPIRTSSRNASRSR